MAMSKEKTDIYELGLLLDFYGQLLTENQYNALDYHCNSDLSMSEIAEEFGISRQGAYDFIKMGRKKLLELEDKLGLVARFSENRDKLLKVKDYMNNKEYNKAEDLLDEVIKNGI